MTQMTAAREGHDSPVSLQDHDDYRRWPVASAISNIIASTSPDYSTRIGLYGRWGDGKTTVLNFLELQQVRLGNVVLRFSPWGAVEEGSVWATFSKTLKQALSGAGVEFDAAEARKRTTKGGLRILGRFGGSAAEVADKFLPVPVASTLAGPALAFLERFAGLGPDDIDAMLSNLRGRRVVVFIDDLDRADPAIIPKLLLTLRELLDLPRFVFVLAFDRVVVSKALGSHNPGWGKTGDAFLEKIVDFPFELPEPSEDQVFALATRFFEPSMDFLPRSSLEGIRGLLPANPRRLKLFARLIASLGSEARRHNAGELDWQTILVFHLVRLESEDFAKRLINEVMNSAGFSWMAWSQGGRDAADEEARFEEIIRASFEDADERIPRVRHLTQAWRRRRAFHGGERLKYQVAFALQPHTVTWAEFRDTFASWRQSRERQVFDAFVAVRARESEATQQQVAEELLEVAVGHYGAIIESASETYTEEDHRRLVDEANDVLSAIEAILLHGAADVAPVQLPVAKVWQRLYGIARQWVHFAANEGEPELREREQQVLSGWATECADKNALFSSLQLWDLHVDAHDGRNGNLRLRLRQRIGEALWPFVVRSSLELFERPNAVDAILSRGTDEVSNFAFASPASPIYIGENRERLFQLLHRAHEEPVLHRNAFAFFELVTAALSGHGRYCTPDQRTAQVAADPQLFVSIWKAVTSRRLQFRMLQSLRERRERLITAGIDGAELPLPQWAEDRAV